MEFSTFEAMEKSKTGNMSKLPLKYTKCFKPSKDRRFISLQVQGCKLVNFVFMLLLFFVFFVNNRAEKLMYFSQPFAKANQVIC